MSKLQAANAEAKLAEAFQCLHARPERSESLCRAVLAEGDDPGARLMLAGARRLLGDFAGACALAQGVAGEHTNWGGAQFEHGMALGRLGRHADALDALRRAESLGAIPGLPREIGDQMYAMGDLAGAEQAYLLHLSARTFEPLVHGALAAAQRNDAARAERDLRMQLAHYPSDVLALRHLAELLSASGRFDEAEGVLRKCLERAPSFALGRFGLAMVLLHNHKLAPALEEAEALLARDPQRLEYLNLKADALGRIGDFEAAATCLELIIAINPDQASAWHSYGHVLRSLGRREQCESAYRRAIALQASLGEAYWGLANLKTFRFGASDLAAMREHATLMPPGDDRISLLFALGKAFEDIGDFEPAFAAYSEANAARRIRFPFDRSESVAFAQRARQVFTPTMFSELQNLGYPAEDPIFIVGMPRSGSTLVEQILASHSSVEGTMELVELIAMVKRLEAGGSYPELLADMRADDLRALGEEYLKRTRVFRKTAAGRFIDKLPNNFAHTGLIHLILPRARIIDVRRHPLACCVSNFKQHWATGQNFAYDLTDLGVAYRNYVELMAHFDIVLPGRVYRVIYEDLVASPEAEIRRLLNVCGLQFEELCLRFYDNDRAIRTPSSEQVRRPIFNSGLDNWRPFEPWLAPLKSALGAVLDTYPAAPPI